jgi:transcriptional regulator with XRE-family HTH domain
MKARLGAKVRSLRRRKGLTQTEVASRLGISPSYLNLIEHDQRQLPANLLLKTAEIFNVELAAFTDDSQSRLAADLQELFGDPLFEEHPLTTADLRELADNPPAARAVIALYQAYRNSIESTRALSSKLYDGRDFAGVNPAHLPSEEVSDVIQLNLNFFSELEAAAEKEALAAKLACPSSAQRLRDRGATRPHWP